MRFAVRIHQSGWTYSELENVWGESERLGYDGASLYDVLGAPGPECWTALTALTRATHKLVAVPLVLSNPYRHPAVVAKMAATLDALSGGRIILGLGAGGSADDAAAFGVQWPSAEQRIAALGEAVEVMRMLWRGGGSFGGRWYELRDAPGYPGASRPEGPPVLIGGHGRNLLRIAARHADLCNVGFDLSVGDWHRLRRRLADQAREAGRPPDSPGLVHNATVLLGADEADVARQVSQWADRRRLTEEAARSRLRHSLSGTPREVCEQLRALEAAGVSWVFLLFDSLPSLEGLRSFAEAVMPDLRSVRSSPSDLPSHPTVPMAVVDQGASATAQLSLRSMGRTSSANWVRKRSWSLPGPWTTR
jgi:alkanesulfonate monooxygenase SsuD/methylene tetrahydromethanopterin reductase-like flavin-dependent oxidoreductase (luciferase family)